MVSALFLRDLAFTLLAYTALTVSYLGFGWLTSRALPGASPLSKKPFLLIWLGWAIVLFIFQVLHVFMPINALVSIPVLSLGMIPAILYIRAEFKNNPLSDVSPVWLALLLIAAVIVATLSMQAPKAYDSGLYHFNSVRWINETPLVLGLGNLHSRLAFNQSFFTFVASLNLYPFFKHGHNIANSFLLLLLLGECLRYFARYVTKRDANRPLMADQIAGMFIIPPLFYTAFTPDLSSPTPDIASAILQMLIFIYFLNELESHTQGDSADSSLAFIFILSATAITLKISNLVYVLTACIILLAIRLKTWRSASQPLLLRATRLLILPTLIILIWGLRGILLSGCPLYPSTIGCVKASWSMPLTLVREEASWIYSWARLPREHPHKVLASWDWLEPWYNSTILGNKISVIYPVAIFTVLVAFSLFTWTRNSASKAINRQWWLSLLPIFIGLLFWFFSAPDIRFVQSLFWILPVVSSLILIKTMASPGQPIQWMVVVLFLTVNANIGWSFLKDHQRLTDLALRGYAPIRSVRLISQITSSGLEVLTPAKEDQCWNSELPCSPNFNANLDYQDNVVFPKFLLLGKN